MAALNYAGIDMSDCYTAIKNIAKKRVDKVLVYKDTFINGFKNAIINDEGCSEKDAEEMANKLWQIIEDSSMYSFNASHSYSVSVDSLYGAWLKAHHPLEFYETYITIQEAKGDKDKMNLAKEEAENYFGIKFPPFRYGQDNRAIKANLNENTITNSISAIKGYSASAGEILYECSLNKFEKFVDLLRWLDERSFKSSKIIPLIKIDYFQEFGNNSELLRIIEMWDFFSQGKSKSIKKEKLSNELASIVSKYATDKGVKGNELKSFTITDIYGLLREIEDRVLSAGIPELDYRVKAANQFDCLGYVDLTTGKEEDRRKLYVLDKYELPDRFKGGVWKYKIKTKSVGSGKVATLDILPNIYKTSPINKGDIIYVVKFDKDSKGYWNLYDYKILH